MDPGDNKILAYEDLEMGFQVGIPDIIQRLGDVSMMRPYNYNKDEFMSLEEANAISKKKGKGKVGQSSRSIQPSQPSQQTQPSQPRVVQLSAILPTIKKNWTKGRPEIERQNLMRNVILGCYILASQNTKKGSFTIEDISFSDGVANINLHKSKSMLGSSLYKVAKIVFNDVAESHSSELTYFFSSIRSCTTIMDFARLYHQPLLFSERETIYFLLDFMIMVDYYSITVDVKTWLKRNYMVTIPDSNKEEFQSLFAHGSYGKHYIGALERCKTFIHHFNDGVREHLPLERIIEKFFQCCPTLHMDLFKNLFDSDFDFSIFFEGDWESMREKHLEMFEKKKNVGGQI